jgi:predicted nucleic acid-binding protein
MSVAHLLDSCIVSHYLARGAGKKTPALVQRVEGIIAADGARISVVTLYEIDRGLKKLALRGEGRRKQRLFSMFFSTTTIYGMDALSGRAWNVASDLHARAANESPAIVFEEGDLLSFATALANQLKLVTSDERLAARIRQLELDAHVECLPVA